MLIVLIVLGVLLVVVGVIMEENCWDMSEIVMTFGAIISVISILAILACGISLSQRMVVDDKISLYQTENKNIENQISSTVESYKKYEQDTLKSFKSESVITLFTLYPELKTDELVKKQIDLYIANNEKIKELNLEKLSYKPLAWWIYFGK